MLSTRGPALRRRDAGDVLELLNVVPKLVGRGERAPLLDAARHRNSPANAHAGRRPGRIRHSPPARAARGPGEGLGEDGVLLRRAQVAATRDVREPLLPVSRLTRHERDAHNAVPCHFHRRSARIIAARWLLAPVLEPCGRDEDTVGVQVVQTRERPRPDAENGQTCAPGGGGIHAVAHEPRRELLGSRGVARHEGRAHVRCRRAPCDVNVNAQGHGEINHRRGVVRLRSPREHLERVVLPKD